MKLFTYIAVVLPLVAAIAVPSSPEKDQSLDTLDLIHGLVEEGKIDLKFDQSLQRRWDVPGLNCGSRRAIRCAQQSAGLVATCVWAAISLGRDIKEDTKCQAAIIAIASNLPRDCALCFSNIIH